MTPFEAVNGWKPPTVMQHLLGEIKVEVVARDLRDRDESLKQLRSPLPCAQDQMRHSTNVCRRDVVLEVSDWVYIKLRPHKQQYVVQRIHSKLALGYYGPFQVIQLIGPVAYKLHLLATSKIHPVFHVSILKHAMVTHPISTALHEELTLEEFDDW